MSRKKGGTFLVRALVVRSVLRGESRGGANSPVLVLPCRKGRPVDSRVFCECFGGGLCREGRGLFVRRRNW